MHNEEPDDHEQDSEEQDSEELDADEHDDDELTELSLDNLGAAYAKAAAEHDPESFVHVAEETPEAEDDDSAAAPVDFEDEEEGVATPESIVEASLFVGHPENKSFSEERLASLMRDVTPEEVIEIIDGLNSSYREAEQGIRIVRDDHGYRMTIAPAVEKVRRSFLGKVREAKLSQAAIEVLALVAYQPGVTTQIVQDQRGRESGSLLNQLVRRRLLEMRREKPADGGRAVPHYYPTERFLQLFGLETLEDLPHVEEGIRDSL
ncbi:SMC-Scp complex subunit ScpB [Planctomycetes bacterium K23_9]|uniref:Segregation and condensation protein B n=1 Tax=Stieleria marina TaxID=1930275 RepID=A0A517NTB0_9BACT|nr:Segregation and condensation protein B [Planctomycetes bacterium K23_9]